MAAEAEAADLLERARRADLQARSDEALELLQGCEDWPVPYNERGVLLRAQVLVARDPMAALDALPEDAEAFTTDEARVGYLLTCANAYRAARNLTQAEALIEEAARQVSDCNNPSRYEIAYLRARMKWNGRRYDPQDPDLVDAFKHPAPEWRFHALNLRAWMYFGLEDYRAEARDLLACMQLYRQYPDQCRLTAVAATLLTLSFFAWELFDENAAREAHDTFDAFPWSAELETVRHLCLRGLAWAAFLQADLARSRQLFDESKKTAPTMSLRALAYADDAYAARLGLDAQYAERKLSDTQELADSVDWRTSGEERMALLTVAVLTAQRDPAAAQRYASKYNGLYALSMPERVAASYEPALHAAHQKYADGCVQEALRNTRVAIELFSDAYATFARLDHVFRATLSARSLYRLTGNGVWLSRARSHARAFPNSPIAMELSAASTHGR